MYVSLQGHAAPILYSVWAEAGFLQDAELLNLRKIDSVLEGHPVPVSAHNLRYKMMFSVKQDMHVFCSNSWLPATVQGKIKM